MNRAISYSEVYEILNLIGKEYKDKIPNKLLQIIVDGMDKNYKPTIDMKKPLKEQNISQRTYDILGMLKLNYWCKNESEKKEFLNKISANEKRREEVLREKYNIDNIFKNGNTEKVKEEVALVEVKEEKWYQKIFNLIKNLFHRN